MSKQFILHVLGFPGAGKLTVLKEFCIGKDEVILIDNHKVNNALFQAVDITKPLPSEIFPYLDKMNDILYEVIEKLSPKDKSFALTNVLFDDEDESHICGAKICDMCSRINYEYIPIRLVCNQKELNKRIVSEERKANMKLTDTDMLNSFITDREVLITGHQNEITIDNTDMSPHDVVKQIKEHIDNVLS